MEGIVIAIVIMVGLCFMVSNIHITIDHSRTSDDKAYVHSHNTEEQPKTKVPTGFVDDDALKKEAAKLAELNKNRPADPVAEVLGRLTEFMTGGELNGEDDRAKE